MKIKQILFLLTFISVSVILNSCNNKDLTDYREKYEGTYACTITGEMVFADFDPPITVPFSENRTKVVQRVDFITGEAAINFSEGENDNILAFVDDNGNLGIIPPYKDGDLIPVTGKMTDPTSGNEVNYTYVVEYEIPSGTITPNSFHFSGSYSGTATMQVGGRTIESPVSGEIVYDGTRK